MGILILILVVIRFVKPPLLHACLLFPARMSSQERLVASASRTFIVYVAVCAAAGRVGMLSAARYPIRYCLGRCIFPPSLPHSVMLLRSAAENAHGSRLPLGSWDVHARILERFCFTRSSCETGCSAVWRRGESARAREFPAKTQHPDSGAIVVPPCAMIESAIREPTPQRRLLSDHGPLKSNPLLAR